MWLSVSSSCTSSPTLIMLYREISWESSIYHAPSHLKALFTLRNPTPLTTQWRYVPTHFHIWSPSRYLSYMISSIFWDCPPVARVLSPFNLRSDVSLYGFLDKIRYARWTCTLKFNFKLLHAYEKPSLAYDKSFWSSAWLMFSLEIPIIGLVLNVR